MSTDKLMSRLQRVMRTRANSKESKANVGNPTFLVVEAEARIGRRLWLASYALEENRTRHADHGRYMRSAMCCVGLAAMRLIGALK